MGTNGYIYLLSCQCILYIVRSFSSFLTIHRPSMILPSKNHKHATDHSPSRSSNSISADHVSSMNPEQFITRINPRGITLQSFDHRDYPSRYRPRVPRSYSQCMMALQHFWIRKPNWRRRGEIYVIRCIVMGCCRVRRLITEERFKRK